MLLLQERISLLIYLGILVRLQVIIYIIVGFFDATSVDASGIDIQHADPSSILGIDPKVDGGSNFVSTESSSHLSSDLSDFIIDRLPKHLEFTAETQSSRLPLPDEAFLPDSAQSNLQGRVFPSFKETFLPHLDPLQQPDSLDSHVLPHLATVTGSTAPTDVYPDTAQTQSQRLPVPDEAVPPDSMQPNSLDSNDLTRLANRNRNQDNSITQYGYSASSTAPTDVYPGTAQTQSQLPPVPDEAFLPQPYSMQSNPPVAHNSFVNLQGRALPSFKETFLSHLDRLQQPNSLDSHVLPRLAHRNRYQDSSVTQYRYSTGPTAVYPETGRAAEYPISSPHELTDSLEPDHSGHLVVNMNQQDNGHNQQPLEASQQATGMRLYGEAAVVDDRSSRKRKHSEPGTLLRVDPIMGFEAVNPSTVGARVAASAMSTSNQLTVNTNPEPESSPVENEGSEARRSRGSRQLNHSSTD